MTVTLFDDMMLLPPVTGSQAFHQPYHVAPATPLWQLFTLVELTEYMWQQGSTEFIDVLNAPRIGEIRAVNIAILMNKLSKMAVGLLEKALRIYTTNKQVNRHNQVVLEHFI